MHTNHFANDALSDYSDSLRILLNEQIIQDSTVPKANARHVESIFKASPAASGFRLIRLLRLYRNNDHFRIIDDFVEFHRVRMNATYLRIIRNFLSLVGTCHIFACVFVFIGRKTYEQHSRDIVD